MSRRRYPRPILETYEIVAGKYYSGWVDENPRLRETRRRALMQACVRYGRLLRDDARRARVLYNDLGQSYLDRSNSLYQIATWLCHRDAAWLAQRAQRAQRV